MGVEIFAPTAIAMVPVAPTIIISVVTKFVVEPRFDLARLVPWADVVGIQAIAGVTILEAHAATTTVTAIPSTTAHVVVVIAEPIAKMSQILATQHAVHRIYNNLLVWVKTGTFCTVRSVLVGAATITAVPVATTVVVLVITEIIANPCLLGASCVALCPVELDILAFALGAVIVLHVASAAVATVPIARADVVFVVTVRITLPCWLYTSCVSTVVEG